MNLGIGSNSGTGIVGVDTTKTFSAEVSTETGSPSVQEEDTFVSAQGGVDGTEQPRIATIDPALEQTLIGNTYHSNEDIGEICQWLEQTYPEYVETSIVGWSHEGQPIYGIRLTKESDGSNDKQKVFMSAALHAREVDAPESLLQIIATFLNDPEYALEKRDMFFIPLANPDGRDWVDYGWSNVRKNRNFEEVCFNEEAGHEEWNDSGVDLNRDFPTEGSSEETQDMNPCSGTYPGEIYEYEWETQAVIDAYRQFAGDTGVDIAIDNHTAGNWIFFREGSPQGELVAQAGWAGGNVEYYASLVEFGEREGYDIGAGSALEFYGDSGAKAPVEIEGLGPQQVDPNANHYFIPDEFYEYDQNGDLITDFHPKSQMSKDRITASMVDPALRMIFAQDELRQAGPFINTP